MKKTRLYVSIFLFILCFSLVACDSGSVFAPDKDFCTIVEREGTTSGGFLGLSDYKFTITGAIKNNSDKERTVIIYFAVKDKDKVTLKNASQTITISPNDTKRFEIEINCGKIKPEYYTVSLDK